MPKWNRNPKHREPGVDTHHFHDSEEVITLALCEQYWVHLEPNILYRFEALGGCTRCEAIEAKAKARERTAVGAPLDPADSV
jgi:hypothetical protein